MNEIQPEERMLVIINAAVQMDPAPAARVAFDGRAGINHFQLVRIGGDAEVGAWHDRDL